jgi:TolB-like protein
MLKPFGKLSLFINELKRRNVLRSLAIYAGSAFVILEATTIIFPRWGFPDWTIDLVLWLLILGAFITLIVAWVFDITPEGVQKTKPLAEVLANEKPKVSNGWKVATYISLVVIVAFIIFNVVPVKKLRAGDIQSLVILPFDNFTGDDQLDYFVSGMHASLIGDMGKVGGLRVIGKTSSNVYKGTNKSAPDIANELNVDALVEPTVMCLGDSICIQIRIITPFPEEKEIWVADYKEEKSKILNLYNRITRQIAEEVKIQLTPEEQLLLTKSILVDKEAYDAYLMGRFYWDDLSPESLNRAMEYLNEAIDKDPKWAAPYAGIAQVWVGLAQMGLASPEIAGPKIFENLLKALELDPDFSDSHFISGIIAVWTEWNWEKGEREFLQALSINPNDAMSRIYYAHLLMILQRTNEALSQGQRAVELDPLNPLVQSLYGVVLSSAGDWEAALEVTEKALDMDPDNFFSFSVLEVIAFHYGMNDRALEAVKVYLQLDNDVMKNVQKISEEQGLVAGYEEILHHLEIQAQNSFLMPVDMAMRYNFVNRPVKALDWLEMAVEIHDPNIPYIGTGFAKFESLYNDPRFIAILENINLPKPEQ